MHALSPREGEVYHLVAEGMSNKEIGSRLGISHKTVSLHVNKIFLKLGIKRRMEIVLAESVRNRVELARMELMEKEG